MECCSSSAVDLRFCWSVPRSGAGSGWSLLLFWQKANEERTEEKTARLLHPSQVAYIWGQSSVRGTRPSTYATQTWLCNEKPSRCWLGAVPRYWKVVASCFQIVSFAKNTSVPLAPRARISQPILLLFFCFLALEFFYKTVSQIFFIPSQNLVAFKRRRNWLKKGYFRTFSNI